MGGALRLIFEGLFVLIPVLIIVISLDPVYIITNFWVL